MESQGSQPKHPAEKPEDDESISCFFDSMQMFRLKWNSLNERCKNLEECLRETETEKNQLKAKLALSRDYAQKIEKEKENLSIFVKQLRKYFEQNAILKWIETLSQKISTLNETSLINPRVIDEITINSSDDEIEDNSDSVLFASDQETHSNSREDSHSTVQSSSNSTTTDVADHNYSFASSTSLPNEHPFSTDCEVSVVDTIVSIENSPQRDSSDDPVTALNETLGARSDDISYVSAHSSSQNSPSIVDNIEHCAVVEREIIDDDLIPESYPPSSPEYTLRIQSSNEETSPLTEEEQDLDASGNFSVDVQILSKSSPQRISSTKDQIFPRNELISRTITSPKMLHQSNEKSVSPTNDYKNTNHSQNSEIDTNLSDPPQLIPIADIEKSINEQHNSDSGSNSATSPPTLIKTPPRCIPLLNSETNVENDAEITNLNQHVPGNSQVSAQLPQSRYFNSYSAISNENGIDFQVSLSDVVSTPYQKHLQFNSKSLVLQGVSHEEICPAEDAPLTNVPDVESSEESNDADTFAITNRKDESRNGGKSNNNQATSEELMSEIFGSPITSPDRDPDVVCIPNEPNCMIDLNWSDDEKQSASIMQPELTVNLVRILAPKFKVTEESASELISRLKRETDIAENNQAELLNSKRPSSSSEVEPQPKRPPRKSSDIKSWKCLLCDGDEEFKNYAALDTHIIATHPNSYPFYFRCHYGQGNCQRHFRTSKQMNDHVRRRHVGEDLSLPLEKLFPGQNPWQCTVCDKIYAQSNHLRAHLHQTHNVSDTEAIGKNERKMHSRKNSHKTSSSKSQKNGYPLRECVICLNDEGSSDKFRSYQDLDDHILKNHPSPYPFYLRCPFCKNKNTRHFKGLSWLNNHVNNYHSSRISPVTN